MRLARFRTVRGRLLAIMAVIALPVALAAGVAAFSTYRAVVASIESAQLRVADDFAVRLRVWYRGAVRTLMVSAGAAAERQSASVAECQELGRSLLAALTGYLVLHVERSDGTSCTATVDPALKLDARELAAVLARVAARPEVRPWSGAALASARYDYVSVGGVSYIAVYADQPRAGRFRQAVLLIDPDLLDRVFDLGVEREGVRAALVGPGGVAISARGATDLSWLPRHEVVPHTLLRWSAPSRDSERRAYAARMVADPDFYVVASFDDRAERAAQLQFWLSLGLPTLMLLALAILYTRGIDRHCIRWLRTIESVARARPAQTGARVVVSPDMPDDIRSVADAFNEMVQSDERKQHKLQGALDDNRYLVRELHHRVKNSLQVVQSYLGLARREYHGEARTALADAECRVHVLSAAYRFTLADGEMQPVRVDLFLDDVVTMISNLLSQRGQRVTGRCETSAMLAVDRIIPLGFLIVDVASRALRQTPGVAIDIIVDDIDDATIVVTMRADRPVDLGKPPRMVAGLLAQVEAEVALSPDGRELGAWRIAHLA